MPTTETRPLAKTKFRCCRCNRRSQSRQDFVGYLGHIFCRKCYRGCVERTVEYTRRPSADRKSTAWSKIKRAIAG